MKTRRRRVNGQGVLYVALFTSLVFAFALGAIVTNRNEHLEQMRIEEQKAVMPWRITSRIVGYVTFGIFAKVGIAVMACYVIYYLIAIARNWLDTQSRLIRQKDGIFPLVRSNEGQLYDPNRAVGENPYITLAALQVQNTAALPRAEKTVIRTTQKASKVTSENMTMLESDNVNLPDMIRLSEIGHNPTLNNLVIGVGECGLITTSLHDLMHTLTVGASGFGKSAFLRMLLYQLAQVQEPVHIVGIDPFGSELHGLQNWRKLLYPIADNVPSAIATLQATSNEITRRKELFSQHPKACDLNSYNQLAPEKLNPIVLVCDEGTGLLNEKHTTDPLRQVVQLARKFGIYCLLAGQSANHKIMPTQIRDNFSSRLCYHASPSSRRVVLGESVDDVTIKGRAWAQLTGQAMQQIQTPYVTRNELFEVMEYGSPKNVINLEATTPTGAQDDGTTRHVIELKEHGASDTRIAREVFGYGNSFYIEKVRGILQQQQQ